MIIGNILLEISFEVKLNTLHLEYGIKLVVRNFSLVELVSMITQTMKAHK